MEVQLSVGITRHPDLCYGCMFQGCALLTYGDSLVLLFLRPVHPQGVLVESLRKGYWIILDELNLAPSEVNSGFPPLPLLC